MQLSRVEDGESDLPGLDDQGEFRAAQHDTLRSPAPQLLDLTKDEELALRLENTQREFLLDDSVQLAAALGRARRNGIDSVARPQSIGDEAVLHGVQRSDQTDLRQAQAVNRGAGGIGDVQNGYAGPLRDQSVDLVRSVGAEDDGLSSRRLQMRYRICQEIRDRGPVSLRLQLMNPLLIQVIENQGWIRVVVVRLVYRLVDVPIVLNGGVPRGAADQADHLHVGWCRKRWGLGTTR